MIEHYNYNYGENIHFPHDEEISSCGYNACLNPYVYKKLFENGLCIERFNYSEYKDCDIIDLYTIGDVYNLEILDYNCKLLKKYFKHPFRYTIISSSCDENIINEIQELCMKYDYIYMRFHSLSECNFHRFNMWGIYLNYVFYELIKNNNYNYFGFLDADVFFYRDFDIYEHFKNLDCFGKTRTSMNGIEDEMNIWYLWYGFSFYKKDKFKKLDFTSKYRFMYENFMKGPFYETGGRNYFKYFYNMKERDLDIAYTDDLFLFMVETDLKYKNDITHNDVRAYALENLNYAYHFQNSGLWSGGLCLKHWNEKWENTKKLLDKL